MQEDFTPRYPKTRDIQETLLAAGFRFELDNPNRKRPALIVRYQEEIIPPGVRMPLMRATLRDKGWKIRGGIKDACYLIAVGR